MRLHVLVQGLTRSGGLINSCERVDFGFMSFEEVVNLLRSIPPPPPDYAEWECGVTLTVESRDRRAYVMVTVNGLDDYTVIKYDETSGEEILVGSSAPFSRVVESLRAFFSEPSGRGLSPGSVPVEEFGYNFRAESAEVVGYDRRGRPEIVWVRANFNVSNKSIGGIPYRSVKYVTLLEPVPGRQYPEVVIEYWGSEGANILRFRFRDGSAYARVREVIYRLVPQHLIRVG